MFKNYLKIALRNIIKYKGCSFINIIGLACGMACAMLILLWVFEQLSYDKFHENRDRIYRVCVDLKAGSHMIYPLSMPPLTPVLINEYPEVEDAVRIARPQKVSIKYQDKLFSEDLVCYVDNSLFDVFTFPFVKGDPQNALENPYTIVITETMTEKYFGGDDPIGKILKINGNTDYSITGIVKDMPNNSHFKFNMACSYQTLYAQNSEVMENWFHIQFYTYLLLKDNKSAKLLENKFPELVDRYIGEQLRGIGGSLKLFLQPLTRIHLYSDLSGEIAPQSDISYVYLFLSIAILIIILTVINFINLTTARSSIRAHEIAIRKTLGSLRRNISIQFLSESIFISLISLLIAGVLFALFIPLFQNFLKYEFTIGVIDIPWIVLGFIGIAIITGVFAGIYPALHLSSFRPVYIYKNRQISGVAGSKFRNFLVLIQFAISIIMIVGTIAIYKQIHYLKNKKLGFNKEYVVAIPGVNDVLKNHSFTTIRYELLSLPGIVNVSGASLLPGTGVQKGLFHPEGFSANEHQLMECIYVDPNYISTMGMKIVLGRNFLEEHALDATNSLIINETAARKLEWENPLEMKFIFQSETGEENKNIYIQVIGVVQDFHSASLHKQVEPLVIFNNVDRINYLALRITSGDISNTLKELEQKWKEFSPDKSFRSFFLDNVFDQLYNAEERLGRLILCFSIIAILLGCLGLFGLVAFIADRQTKNVGIRKVFGASVLNIVNLYIKDFLKYVLIANMIAWPVAYYFIMKWFENFAYRTSVGIWIYIASGTLAFLITIFTIGYQTIKSATSNPVDALRYE